MKLFVSQSNYIPWKGFIDAIQLADMYVLYDEMQYTKRDWRNRNLIKTHAGLQWLTIPVRVKGKRWQKINETEIANPFWAEKHWKSIVQSYQKAPFFSAYHDWCKELYESATDMSLSQINYHFLRGIADVLDIRTPFQWSASFSLPEGKNEKLIHLCRKLNATHYITGPSARNYIDVALFRQNGIEIIWLDYSEYPSYPQLFPPFTHHISILDLIFNTGPAASTYMQHFSQPVHSPSPSWAASVHSS